MRSSILSHTPLGALFRDLKDNVKRFVREEVELGKREMSEKISCYSHNAINLAIGGVIAYAGLIVFLAGLGILVAFAFQKLGLDQLLANFLGLGTIGLIVIAVGAVMILKAMKAFSSGSFVPERTIATIKHLKGEESVESPSQRGKKKEAPKRAPAEIEQEVLATEQRIGETLEEIAYRTSPTRIKDQTVEHIRSHPYQWSLLALTGGFVGSFLLGRKFSKA